MNTKLSALIVGIALLLLASFSSATPTSSVYASANSVSLTDKTEAVVTLTIFNDAAYAQTFDVQAHTADLIGWFSEDSGSIAPQATRTIKFHLSAPSCYQGDYRIPIYISLRGANGATETNTVTLVASVYASRECPQYNVPHTENYNQYNGGHEYFDPSTYSVAITPIFPKTTSMKMEPALFRTIKVQVRNTGAAGTFTLKLIGDTEDLRPLLTDEVISLQRNEVATVVFDIRATNVPVGETRHLALQILHEQQSIGWQDYNFHFQAPAALNAPVQSIPKAPVNATSSQYTIEFTVENPTNSTMKEITATILGLPSGWVVKTPAAFDLAPGENQTKKIFVEATTSEDAAKPELVVYSQGKEIARQKLDPIKGKPSGLTGLIVGTISDNLLLVVVILVAAVVVVLAAGRYNENGEDAPQNASYDEKLGVLRDAVGNQQ